MATATKLTPERVEAIFLDCLFREDEDTSQHVKAEGLVHHVGFHPQRIAQHAAEIAELLEELPAAFKKEGGGGMSFLNACEDKHGNQWTGLHVRMEQLFQLGIGIGKVEYLAPRSMWQVLPGGMPYLVVL
jgi:hypothetical protein